MPEMSDRNSRKPSSSKPRFGRFRRAQTGAGGRDRVSATGLALLRQLRKCRDHLILGAIGDDPALVDDDQPVDNIEQRIAMGRDDQSLVRSERLAQMLDEPAFGLLIHRTG